MDSIIPESNGMRVLEELQLEPGRYSFCLTGWADSFSHKPEKLEILQRENICEYCRWSGISEDISTFLCQLAADIEKNRALTAYLWHFYYRLKTPSEASGCLPTSFIGWPLPEPILGRRAVAFPVLVLLGALRMARAGYRADGYDEELIQATLAPYRQVLERSFAETGIPEIKLFSMSWLRIYMSGRLFQLGRFNFKLMEDFSAGIMLKNLETGSKLLLAADGVKMNSAGYVLQEDDPLAAGGWTTRLEESDEGWLGYPVSPRGYAMKQQVCCKKSQWQAIFSPGDVALDMHIPAGGGMTPELCLASFRQAISFFRQHFSGQFNPVFICDSWIFNTQFEESLPDSNLAKLMRECYLYPLPSYGRDGMYFLFGTDQYRSLDELPQKTSVQRAMVKILASGQRLRCGGMLLFAEDLDKFGTACYRSEFHLPEAVPSGIEEKR